MYNFVQKGCNITEMIAFGGIIYFAYTKKPLTGLIYCLPAVAARIYTEWILWPITTVSTSMVIFGSFAILGICLVLKSVITGNTKYFIGMVLLVFYKCFLYAWVANKQICWPVMQLYYVPILCMVIVLTIMVKIKLNINVFNKVIIIIIVVVTIAVGAYQYIEHKKTYNASALGQLNKSGGADIFTQSNEPAYTPEQLMNLTDGTWQAYEAIDNSTGERIIPFDVFGWAAQHTNSLTFDDKGTFEIAIGAAYVFKGKYDFDGSRVVLYSDSTSDVLEMHFGDFESWNGWTAQALVWTCNSIYEDDSSYTIYMIKY